MVFITGSTGLVGGHLLVQLFKRGEKIRALKKYMSGFRELKIICKHYGVEFTEIYDKVEWITGDILDKTSFSSALKDIKTIYHCAAIVSFGNCTPGILQQINIEGTRNITELALEHQVPCFAFVSSIGALGQSKNNEVITEETPWNPNNDSSVYSNSKYLSEQVVWEAAKKGLNVVIVNPGVILGAGDFNKGSLTFFSTVRKGMYFYTHQQTGYVDVRDVCRAMLYLVDNKIYNERFILVSENLTNKQLFTLIARALHMNPPFIPVGRTGLKLGAWLEKRLSRRTGKAPLLTPEIILSASKTDTYSSDKFIRTTGLRFIPMKKCIEEAI